MSGKEPHFAVAFATRYGARTDDYLSARTALCRLEELIDDALNLKSNFDALIPEEKRWAPWVGAEILSYYAVGFVTCLEWHARSRLVDLLTFKPAAARSDDLKIFRDKVVLEMISANVTVASVVGAATNISSLQEYVGVFTRLFANLDSKLDGFGAIKLERADTGKPWVEQNEIKDLENLYTFRNGLVHEIGIHRVGHMNVRDRWDPDEAIRMGNLVLRMMRAMEASVSSIAPLGFPNVLDAEGYPRSEWERLEREIPALEQKIGRITTAFTDQDVDADENWSKAKAAATEYLSKEKLFLDEALMLHNRYVEMRQPLKLALMKSRYIYLKSIIEIVGSVWLLEDAPELIPPTGQVSTE